MFLKKIEAMAAAMPETVQSEGSGNWGPITTTSNANEAGQAGLVNSATGAAGALAGWAIASIGKQMSSTETHSTLSAAPTSSLNPPSISSNNPSASASPMVSPRLSSDSASFFGATSSSSKPSGINVKKAAPRASTSSSGMKLGGVKSKPPGPSIADVLADEWQDADDTGVENAWGNDDLIDVNADTDDWAAFESAPVPEIVVPPEQSYYVNPPSTSAPKKTAPAKPAPTPSPKPASTPKVAPVPVLAPAIPKPSPAPSFAPSMASNDDWGDAEPSRSETASPANAQPSLAGMSKEEKDKEMARRREERKAVSLYLESGLVQ